VRYRGLGIGELCRGVRIAVEREEASGGERNASQQANSSVLSEARGVPRDAPIEGTVRVSAFHAVGRAAGRISADPCRVYLSPPAVYPSAGEPTALRLEAHGRIPQAVRTTRPTNLLISRSHSTALAIAAQNTQSWALKLTVPNAR
jgi:hypothetical protein